MTKNNTPLSNEVINMTTPGCSKRIVPKFNPNREKVSLALKTALGDKLAADLIDIPETWSPKVTNLILPGKICALPQPCLYDSKVTHCLVIGTERPTLAQLDVLLTDPYPRPLNIPGVETVVLLGSDVNCGIVLYVIQSCNPSSDCRERIATLQEPKTHIRFSPVEIMDVWHGLLGDMSAAVELYMHCLKDGLNQLPLR